MLGGLPGCHLFQYRATPGAPIGSPMADDPGLGAGKYGLGTRHGPPTPYNLPPSQLLAEPGPGVGGPGPGVMAPQYPVVPVAVRYSQIYFLGPDGMMVNWNVSPQGLFDSEPLTAPGSFEFPQGALFRLKLTNIPGHAGIELYPTLEVAPATPRTEAFLAHNKVPVAFTDEDFMQVLNGNFVTKVIYLPDPEYQDLAVAGIDVLVSTRLDPGVDPIVEADRRGAILAIIRMGNKDLQLPGPGAANPVVPAGYQNAMHQGMAPGMAPGVAPYGIPGSPSTVPSHISGMTMPQYGMPYTGTPIGLPGPPHIPLGGPAGLKRHSIINHTEHNIPGPTTRMDIHVKQTPGFSYPQPPNQVYIKENVQPGPLMVPGEHVPHGPVAP